MKKILTSLLALFALVSFATPSLAVYVTSQGGTSTSTAIANFVLIGKPDGSGWTQAATSSLGIIGCGSIGSAGQLQFASTTAGCFNATSTLFWDNANGRLGIGTSTPTYPFTVIGTGTDARLADFETSHGASGIQLGDNGANVGTSIYFFRNLSNVGQIGTTNNVLTLSGGATSNTNSVVFKTANGSPLIGIGTTAPTNALTLDATSSITNGGIALYNTADQVTNFERGEIGWASNIFTLGDASGGSGGNRTVRLRSQTNSGSASAILLTRNALPYLDSNYTQTNAVSNTVPITRFSAVIHNAASGNQLIFGITPTISQTGTAGYSALFVNPTETSNGSGPNLLIQAGTSTNNNLFVVNNAGNVGIGTSTPRGILDLISDSSTIPNRFLVDLSGGTNRTLRVSRVGSGMSLDVSNTNTNFSSPNDLIFQNSVAGNGGNVGIGTSTPAAKLDVNNGSLSNLALYVEGGSGGTDIASFSRRAGASDDVVINANGSNPQVAFKVNGSTRFSVGDNFTDNSLRFSTSTVGVGDVMTLTQAGSLGIGTTSPASKLSVQGSSGSAADLFTVASSTSKSYLKIKSMGGIVSSGDLPAVSSCGISPSVSSDSNQIAGAVTIGSGIVTACTVTFLTPYPSGTVVHVFLNQDTGSIVTSDAQSITTSGFTINSLASAGGDVVSYHVIATQ